MLQIGYKKVPFIFFPFGAILRLSLLYFVGIFSFSLESNLSRLSQGFIIMTHQFFRCRQPYPCYLSSDPCLKFWFLHPKFCQFLPSNQHLDHRNLGITKFWKFKRKFLKIWICELISAENFKLKETQKKLPTVKKKRWFSELLERSGWMIRHWHKKIPIITKVQHKLQ